MIRVGTILYGFCGGYFGRDSYDDKRVEAIGSDWVVAREHRSGRALFAEVHQGPEMLEAYLVPKEERG